MIKGLLAFLLLAPGLAFGGDSDFYREVLSLNEKNASEFERISDVGMKGDVLRANQMMLKLADDSKNPAMAFLIANQMFQVDTAASYRLHKVAFDAHPDDKLTILEWAMEQHRAGKNSDAVQLYRSYLKLEPADEKCNALLADCLVRTGEYREAVKAWQAANHGGNHVAIDMAIFEIYGDLSPLMRRADLISKVKAGQTNLIEKLLFLDLNMDHDWWNTEADQEAARQDMQLAEKKLGPKDMRLKDLKCYMDLKTTEPTTARIKQKLSDAGLIIGDNGRLPADSQIASALISFVLDRHMESRQQLLDRFGKSLLERAKSKAGDVEALNALSFLTIGNSSEKLAEYDQYGWERYGDKRFAGSYLAGLLADKKINLNSPELKKAVTQFPEDAVIASLQLKCAGEKDTADMIAQAIKGEYRHLSGDSYTLKSLFANLDARLK
ncbi:hypothetical protein Cflav_PD3044 [Pedosphaera parvula Ellin514]|uniref:Tetratricopeptide domain protein n=2 Tax=Pedosphaera TaxID=1032526 RepID=B9XJC4_PEDPL|nr:hypothetical protein Cflav_PD3044 [Pedosphaera parvula Ellin514]